MRALLSFITLLSALFSSSLALAIPNLNPLAEAIVQSFPGAGKHPEYKGGRVGRLDVMMRVPVKVLTYIDRYGFLNQHRTGTSCGSLDPAWRCRTEHQFLGLKHIGLIEEAHSTDFHPKYGFLAYETSGDTLTYEETNLDASRTYQYGEVFLKFRPQIYSRFTYTMGDSLGGHLSLIPGSNLDPIRGTIGGYIEAQFWGTFSLDDVEEIWVPAHLIPSTQSLAQKYGLKLFQLVEASASGIHTLQLDRSLVQDYSTPETRTPVFKQPSSDDLVSREASADAVEKKIIQSAWMDEKIDQVPEILKPAIARDREIAKTKLLTYLFHSSSSPRVKTELFKSLYLFPDQPKLVTSSNVSEWQRLLKAPSTREALEKSFPDKTLISLLDERTEPGVDLAKEPVPETPIAIAAPPVVVAPTPTPEWTPAPTPVPVPTPEVVTTPSPIDTLEEDLRLARRSEDAGIKEKAIERVTATLSTPENRALILTRLADSKRLAHFVEENAAKLPASFLTDYRDTVLKLSAREDAHNRSIAVCERIISAGAPAEGGAK